jgi:hypothetical protein
MRTFGRLAEAQAVASGFPRRVDAPGELPGDVVQGRLQGQASGAVDDFLGRAQ